LAKVALAVGGVVAALAGVLGAVVQLNVLSQEQADAVLLVGRDLPGIISNAGVVVAAVTGVVAALVAAFGTAQLGKKQVTPVAAPAIEDPANPGTLIPLLPAPGVSGVHGSYGD
jgi:hypothetical protein